MSIAAAETGLDFRSRLVIWNIVLHLAHLAAGGISGRPEHALGVIGSFALTTPVLWLAARGGGPLRPVLATVGYGLFFLTVAFQTFTSFHWYFFGAPFNYSRFIDGVQLVLFEPAHEMSGAWDAFLIGDLVLGVLLIAAPWLRLPHRVVEFVSNRLASRSVAVTVVLSALVCLVSPSARGSNLVAFLASVDAEGSSRRSLLATHRPLRLEFAESSFVREPLVELPDDLPTPNLLIIELESVSAMYYRFYGATEGPELPGFASLLPHGLVGMQHYAINGGSSHNNDWAMLTGLYPPNFGKTPFHQDPWIAQKNLFHYLKQEGYFTGTFYTGNPRHRDHYKLFQQPAADLYFSNRSPEWAALDGDLTGEDKSKELLLAEIDRLAGDQPFAFLYRTYNGHYPYDSRAARPGMSKLERYRHALAEADGVVAEIVQGLKDRGIFEDTMVLLTGDHGESFGQHENLWTHAGGVYEELVRTPLVISYPRLFQETLTIDQPTSHVDILPTLLELTGGPTDDIDELEGYSLLRTLPPDRVVFFANGDDGVITGVRQGRYKLMLKQIGTPRLLFDIEADPLEQHDRVEELEELVSKLIDLEARWLEHRKRGLGRSRWVRPDDGFETTLRIAGNARIDVYLNGDKLAVLADAKKLVLPVRLQPGENYIVATGILPDRGNHTGLYIEIEHRGAILGTGGWWNTSTSAEFVRSGAWLDRTLPVSDTWRPAKVYDREVRRYLTHGRVQWQSVPKTRPFVTRMDFEVHGDRLEVDRLKVRAREGFRLYVDGRQYVKAETEDVYDLTFPRRPAARPDVRLDLTGTDAMYGVLVNGNLSGYQVTGRPDQWECLDFESYRREAHDPAAAPWTEAARLDDHRVIGDWAPETRWLWVAGQESGLAGCRLVY